MDTNMEITQSFFQANKNYNPFKINKNTSLSEVVKGTYTYMTTDQLVDSLNFENCDFTMQQNQS